VKLRPLKESTEDFEEIEKKILDLYKQNVFLPILRELTLPSKTLKNAKDVLLSAIQTGRITFYRGVFSGRFNSSISKELKSLGARWDRKQGTWNIPQSALPIEIRNVISASEARFQRTLATIDQNLSKILPEELADKLDVTKQFDTTLWKTERDFYESTKAITIVPKLSDEQRRRVASEWQNNMRLWIQDWTKKAIVDLRKDVQASAFKGNRYESMISAIQKNFGVTQRKAKFLARQETSLLLSKYRETRYQDAGSEEYIWRCVVGSAKHPVRPMHKRLDGKKFRWDDPPVVDDKGARKNPGQDYNCRCYPIPIVKF